MAEYQEVVDAGPGWTKVRTADGQVVTVEGNRNWRNNNPGNLEYGDFAQSHGAIGTDGRFAVFPNYDAGRSAKESLIFESPNYRDLPLSGAISRYAPSFENDTQSYLNQVATAAGVSPDTPMNQMTPTQRAAVMDAMQHVEGWRVGSMNGSPAPDAPRRLPAIDLGFDPGAPLPSQRRSQAGVQPARIMTAANPPGGGWLSSLMGGAKGGLNSALGAIGNQTAPLMRSAQNIAPAAVMQALSTVQGRTAIGHYLANKNVAKAPVMVAGAQPGGTQVITTGGQLGTLMRANNGQVGGQSSRAFDAQFHPGQNMDVYRTNAAAAGGAGNLNAAGINAALNRGAVMVSANSTGRNSGRSLSTESGARSIMER